MSPEEIALIVRRGAAELSLEIADEVATLIALKAGGDARNALNILELAAETATYEKQPLEARHVEDAARKRPLRYDRSGDAHYDFASAFIKSMRGSDPDAALYYLASMLEAGEEAKEVTFSEWALASREPPLCCTRSSGDGDRPATMRAVPLASVTDSALTTSSRIDTSSVIGVYIMFPLRRSLISKSKLL